MISDFDRLVLEEAEARGLLMNVATLDAHLFPEQKAFVDDPGKFKAAQCSRRAGKSEVAADLLYKAAYQYPGSTPLYVGLTRSSAKNIMWPKLLAIRDKYNLQCDVLEGSLEVKFPNNSRIWLVGADMTNFIDRLRGGAYPIGIIDEAQSFKSHIKELIDDVITPATFDYGGSVYLLGSPGPTPSGYFHDVTVKGEYGYSVHKWTMLDNPHIPNAKQLMNELLVRNSWTTENPTYRREYLNEWVKDNDALIYKFLRDRNVIPTLNLGTDWNRVIGVDYGWNDKTAFAVLAYNQFSPKVLVEHTESHGEMIPSQIGERLKQLSAKYRPEKIVADTGGLGKSITEEMIRRFSIPIQAAEKTDKATWISLMNGDFIDKNLEVMDQNRDLMHQYETLTKSDKDPSKEDATLPNDLCDASLYAWRYIRAYHNQPRELPKTKEQHYQQIEDDIWGAEEEKLQSENSKEWWEK